MTDENRNCELLLEYLQGILHDQDVQPINLDELDEPYKRLGTGLLLLEKAVKEMQRYSGELSEGNLSGQSPSKENLLCENLKKLNSNLNNLICQVKQVAAGDYSRNVSDLGELSEAFDAMTGQLKEREGLLKKEAEKALRRAAVTKQYNELLMELARERHEWILVVDEETRRIVYCNKKEEDEKDDPVCCDYCAYLLSFRKQFLNWTEGDPRNWEADDDKGRSYQISTLSIIWRGRKSYAHVVLDITEQKQRTLKLRMKAYQDPGTGIRNRLYFEERMNEILEKKERAVLCYLDLDGLKAVNDHFGHLEGDQYIRSFVSVIRKKFRSSDEFSRVGGDEFTLILFKCSREQALRKLSEALVEFTDRNEKDYFASFSYGVMEIGETAACYSLEDIIRIVDKEMYICKRQHKEEQSSMEHAQHGRNCS